MALKVTGTVTKVERSKNLKKDGLVVDLSLECDETHNPIAIIDAPLGALAGITVGTPVIITVEIDD